MFCIFEKNSKIQNGHHFWQVKYLLKLGKVSFHRYPVGQKFCRNPTSKNYFMENGFKKYSYMNLYFQFCVLHFLSKIEYDPHFWERTNFRKLESGLL